MLTACSISLRVEPGQLIAIVGSVGSGKSSLLECLLGEMDKLSGTIVMQVSAMFSKTAVAPALSSRDFVARVRDFIARRSRRRCDCRVARCDFVAQTNTASAPVFSFHDPPSQTRFQNDETVPHLIFCELFD